MTLTGTLSLVMASCGGTSMVTVRRSTRMILSTMGMMITSPGPRTPMSRPSRNGTARWYSGTTLMAADRMISTKITTTTTMTAVSHLLLLRSARSGRARSELSLPAPLRRTRRVRPSTPSTSTSSLLRSRPSIDTAFHSSPITRTCPCGSSRVRTRPIAPTSPEIPVTGGVRRAAAPTALTT